MSKRSKKWLVAALILCLLFSFAAGMVQNGFGKVKVSYERKTLSEMIDEIGKNNEAYGKNVEVSFGTASSAIVFGTAANATMEFKLFVPKGASESNRLPAVVLAPGMDDMKDDMYTLSTELARRGFVVAVTDKAGEGNSDLAADGYTNGSAGTEAVIEYVMSLPYVDETQVGVSGHSNGNKYLIIAMNKINLETANHVGVFLMGQGTGFLFRIMEGTMADVKFGMVVGKNDEMDTVYFNSAFYDETDKAKGWIREIYPEFDAAAVPLGTWFTAEGPQELKDGEKLEATEARVLYNPPTTHPGMEFSRSGVKAYVDFFYGAFGVPAGSSYIASGNQLCWVMVTFQLLAMLAFLSLIFPLADWMLSTETFASLKKSVEKENLPALRNPKESGPLVVMLLALACITVLSFFPLYTAGTTLLPPTNLLPLSTNFMNQITYWAMVMALVACGALVIMHWVKKLLYRRSGEKAASPFLVADTTLREFLKSMLFAGCLYALTLIPVALARWLFKVDFRIGNLKFTWYRPERIFVVLRYVACFGLFYVVNAIITANTRFKDVPDGVSTAIVSAGNTLGLVILLIVQYSALVSNHVLKISSMGSATIQVWKYLLPMLLSPVIARYIWNRTRNIWIAAAFNDIFFTAVTAAMTGITTALGLFGL